ncbi:hypothetical protein HMPREF1221_01320 [Treponema socranskii subsp. paredis ATCC 35535]|nr:hypothetical protein HMPREF1221_01320 [Treponema socranskii subsp. paredis ATCC 35535]
MKASARIKEKQLGRFSNLDLSEQTHLFFYKKSPPTVRKPHSLYFPDYIHELTRSGYSNRFFRV